jgi:methylated-DNA-[protein]-cysteine S-methyltransferase
VGDHLKTRANAPVFEKAAMALSRVSTSRWVESPLGKLRLTATTAGLCELAFAESPDAQTPTEREFASANPLVKQHLATAAQWLTHYFAGTNASPCPALDLRGTDFERQVWQALQNVPFGNVATYGDIARAIHRPKAVRALGQANGKNPVPIIVPCHRIIAAGGKLGGYSAGLDRKRWLLRHEGARGWG